MIIQLPRKLIITIYFLLECSSLVPNVIPTIKAKKLIKWPWHKLRLRQHCTKNYPKKYMLKRQLKSFQVLQLNYLLLISEYCPIIFFKIIVDDQNINNIVKALENTEVIFTIKAICSLSIANIAKKAPII